MVAGLLAAAEAVGPAATATPLPPPSPAGPAALAPNPSSRLSALAGGHRGISGVGPAGVVVDGALAISSRATSGPGNRMPGRTAPRRGPGRSRLTGREQEVLEPRYGRAAEQAIAGRLYLSPRTVEKHVERLLAKTGSANRAQLATYALRRRRRYVGRYVGRTDAALLTSVQRTLDGFETIEEARRDPVAVERGHLAAHPARAAPPMGPSSSTRR